MDIEIERAKKIPGPADYKASKKTIMGGRLSPTRDRDMDGHHPAHAPAHDKAALPWTGPGPGQYPIKTGMPGGGRYIAGNRSKTALEHELYTKAKIPGPGMYEPAEKVLRGGRMPEGDRWVEKDNSLRRVANEPGPADYDGNYDGIQARVRREAVRQVSVANRSKFEARRERRRETAGGAARASRSAGSAGSSKANKGLATANEHIRRLWGDRPGSPPRTLPDQAELSWEMRNIEAIRRIYRENGFVV